MADRLSIDKKINDSVVPVIDETKFLGLDKFNISRIDLFMFAMAIGLKERKKTPLSASHGFILESYISGNDFAKMYTLLVDELRRTNEEEKIGDKDAAFRIAQEYANTGFQVIRGWVETRGKKDEDALIWELISDLEEKFATCFPGEN